ncbi:DNA topoisomerase IB [Brachybacterium huguangmaarense]|uniref:DNA topoisomerase n=1 Tax=Brachybacterium huguangmaarense TaxID=1652028 RepID=A0ABY6FY26_9MICO|nr:DNA topoisomerase IB [Brachybacterium huguangmaarense]UYG15832.1 DNA topoisomerase IB [Brachybacterium huguangmaarense]
MARLRTAHPGTDPGIRRRRRGRGWSFVHDNGRAVSAEDRERALALVLPPAWTDVWIAADPLAHIQATGIDDAGRTQYRYHDEWGERRERLKHERALDLAETLPSLRRQVTRDLGEPGLGRERVLAAALRMLDLVAIRAGGDTYADERGTRGLMTLLVRHATVDGDSGAIRLRFPAKSGQRFDVTLEDRDLARCLAELRSHRSGASRLLAFRDGKGVHPLHDRDLNDAVRGATGGEFTAKDFRTLHGTILAATSLARARDVGSARERAAAERAAVAEVAEALGNTVAVARSSYIDPEVFSRFEEGETIDLRGSREKAILRLLR